MISTKRTPILAALAVLCLATAPPATAQPPLCVEYADGNPHLGWSYLPYATVPCVVIDDVAYLGGVGPAEVSAVDISSPPAMPRFAFVRLDDNVIELSRDGDRLYARSLNGITVIDVSDPRDPVRLAWLDLFNVEAMQPDGDRLHVTRGPWGYHILDVSDLAAPETLGSVLTLGNCQGLGLDRDRQLVVLGLASSGMRLLDVSDPRDPVVVSSLTDFEAFDQFEFVGTDLFAGGGIYGLELWDLSSALTPRRVADVTEVEECLRFAIQDGLMVVSDGRAGVHVFDVSRPPRVARVAHHPQLRRTLYAEPAGDGLFLVNLYLRGWTFLDPTVDWIEPATLGTITAPGEVDDLVARDGLLYGIRSITNFASEFFVAPLSPALAGETSLGVLPLTHSGWNIALDDRYAYLAANHLGLSVVDVGDPRAPSLAAQLPLDHFARDVALLGEWLAVAIHGQGSNSGGVAVVDVSDPAVPVQIAFVSLGQRIDAVDVVGNTVVAASERGGLFTIGGLEPGQPPAPEALALVDVGFGDLTDLAVRGDLVYVCGRQTLAVVDCADPLSPDLVWSQELLVSGEQAHRLALVGQRLYVTSEFSGLAVYDVTDPIAPVYLGPATAGGPDFGVAGDSRILALGGDGVVRFLPLDCDLTGAVGGEAARAIPDGGLTVFPSPANPRTTLRFELTGGGPAAVTVYDLRGRRVAELARGTFAAGIHRVVWDGTDRAGRPVASGTYLVRLVAPGVRATRNLTLVR